jgi:hypothetical protein
VLGGALGLLGCPPAHAFVALSTLASLGLLAWFGWLVRARLPSAGERLLAFALLLFHPAMVRCFVRPQTDALLAFFALTSLCLGLRCAQRPVGMLEGVLLFAAQTAAAFVKIHALVLLGVPALVALLAGVRGREWIRLVVASALLPLLAWLGVFWAGDLFGTIALAWETKDRFYQEFDLPAVLWLLAQTQALLLLPALFTRPHRDAFQAAAWLPVVGFAAILAASSIPPLVRFQMTWLAPLALLAVEGRSRIGSPGARRTLSILALVLFAGQSAALVFLDAYGRYWGPARDFAPLDGWLWMSR